MKKIFLILGTLVFSFNALAAHAKDSDQVRRLEIKTKELAKQINELNAELKALRHEEKKVVKREEKLEDATIAYKKKKKDYNLLPSINVEETDTSLEEKFTWGIPVTSAPYFGEHASFNGSNLLVTYPSVNEDLRLLRARQLGHSNFEKANHPEYDELPCIKLSGNIQATANWNKSYTGDKSSDINLDNAELDLYMRASTWVQAYMTLDYEDSTVNLPRTSNSRSYLDKGFVTFGDLSRSPIYVTVGQIYLPFGQFSSAMISTGYTQMFGRIKARAVVVGYAQEDINGFNGALFFSRGDSRTNSNDRINQWGFNLGYSYRQSDYINGDVGLSYIANIADAQRFQKNGVTYAGYFQGFGETTSTEIIQHRVPGFDLRGRVQYLMFSWMAEYVGAMRDFSAMDLSYNGQPARPAAFNTEIGYNFEWLKHPSQFAIGYSRTYQALGLNLPKTRYIAALNTAIWKHTILGLEFRQERNYPYAEYANGSSQINNISPTGKIINCVTLGMSVFF